jgi:hypothetical protein
MNREIAAVLLAATMLTTPAFAATVANSHNTHNADGDTGQGHQRRIATGSIKLSTR